MFKTNFLVLSLMQKKPKKLDFIRIHDYALCLDLGVSHFVSVWRFLVTHATAGSTRRSRFALKSRWQV